ncbi:MAG: hypothetical protein C4576_20240 [Desulfobacteraceae bacterium]|nr:MAG: hypothetical protein C4576_20240 [Desulfobacteraceae bacterium]
MNQVNQTTSDSDEEITLIDLIYPIFKHIRFLILFCVVVVIAVGLYTVKLPKVYEATAVTLPEVKQSDTGSELKAAFLEKFGVAGLGISNETPSEVFEAVLKSEELTRQAIRRSANYFNMGLSSSNERDLVKSVAKTIKVTKLRKEPTLSLSVQASDPYLASDLANSYLVELDIYNRSSNITSAQRLRKYIEKRLIAANTELEQAQQELRLFQEKNKAISISEQAKATILILSDMESRRVALEVDKETIDKFYKGSSVELEKIKAQLTAIQKNIDRLTQSNEDKVALSDQDGRLEFYIPLTRIPSLNFDESRLLLQVKAKTGVVTMLTNQLEQVKLDETKDIPTVNVLDWAEPSLIPIRPSLRKNVLLSGFIALLMGIFLVYGWEYFQRARKNSMPPPKLKEKNGFLTSFLRRDVA